MNGFGCEKNVLRKLNSSYTIVTAHRLVKNKSVSPKKPPHEIFQIDSFRVHYQPAPASISYFFSSCFLLRILIILLLMPFSVKSEH